MKAALTRAVRVARNAAIDLRFGRPLGGAYLKNPDQSNSDYGALEKVFAGRIRPGEVLVDVGCGSGRVLNYWLRVASGHQLYGIELDATLATRTQRRLRGKANVTVIAGDAVELCPANGTLFYLFNPFVSDIVRAFCGRIAEHSTVLAPRILYYNPKHLDVLREAECWDIEIVDVGGGGAPYQPLAVAEFRK
jgi:SAM-dependent methyltransferase